MYQRDTLSKQKDNNMGPILRKGPHPTRGLTSRKEDPSKQEEDSMD